MSDKGEVCASCNLDDEIASRGMMLSPLVIVALVAAVAPFFISFSTSSSVTVNGATAATYRDYAAIGGGAFALLIGTAAAASARKPGAAQRNNLLAALGAIGLGVYQLLRGFGVV